MQAHTDHALSALRTSISLIECMQAHTDHALSALHTSISLTECSESAQRMSARKHTRHTQHTIHTDHALKASTHGTHYTLLTALRSCIQSGYIQMYLTNIIICNLINIGILKCN